MTTPSALSYRENIRPGAAVAATKPLTPTSPDRLAAAKEMHGKIIGILRANKITINKNINSNICRICSSSNENLFLKAIEQFSEVGILTGRSFNAIVLVCQFEIKDPDSGELRHSDSLESRSLFFMGVTELYEMRNLTAATFNILFKVDGGVCGAAGAGHIVSRMNYLMENGKLSQDIIDFIRLGDSRNKCNLYARTLCALKEIGMLREEDGSLCLKVIGDVLSHANPGCLLEALSTLSRGGVLNRELINIVFGYKRPGVEDDVVARDPAFFAEALCIANKRGMLYLPGGKLNMITIEALLAARSPTVVARELKRGGVDSADILLKLEIDTPREVLQDMRVSASQSPAASDSPMDAVSPSSSGTLVPPLGDDMDADTSSPLTCFNPRGSHSSGW